MNTTTRKASTTTAVILAVTEPTIPAGIRIPDMLDEGMAFWMGANGVVSLPMERVADVAEILAATRFVDWSAERASGWIRLAPSHYGVEVDCYGSDPSAQVAWDVLTEAVSS